MKSEFRAHVRPAHPNAPANTQSPVVDHFARILLEEGEKYAARVAPVETPTDVMPRVSPWSRFAASCAALNARVFGIDCPDLTLWSMDSEPEGQEETDPTPRTVYARDFLSTRERVANLLGVLSSLFLIAFVAALLTGADSDPLAYLAMMVSTGGMALASWGVSTLVRKGGKK